MNKPKHVPIKLARSSLNALRAREINQLIVAKVKKKERSAPIDPADKNIFLPVFTGNF